MLLSKWIDIFGDRSVSDDSHESFRDPCEGDSYSYISNDGQILTTTFGLNPAQDDGRRAIGNCFRTESEAKLFRVKLIFRSQMLLYGGRSAFKPGESNWHVVLKFGGYQSKRRELCTIDDLNDTSDGLDVYFDSDYLLKKAIASIGKNLILNCLMTAYPEFEDKDEDNRYFSIRSDDYY